MSKVNEVTKVNEADEINEIWQICRLPKDLLKIIVEYTNSYLDIFRALAYDIVLNSNDSSLTMFETLKEVLIKSNRADLIECMKYDCWMIDKIPSFLNYGGCEYDKFCKWRLVDDDEYDDKKECYYEKELENNQKCRCGNSCTPPYPIMMGESESWIVDSVEEKIIFGNDTSEFEHITILVSNWRADWIRRSLPSVWSKYNFCDSGILEYFHHFQSPHQSLGFEC